MTTWTGLSKFTWIAAPLLWLGGCGTGATPDGFKPPIATLHGEGGIGSGTGSASSDLRLALVWNAGHTADGFRRRIPQDVGFVRTAPATYDIAITERPPDEALENGPATARLLAYYDRNHNHTLDFASVDDDAFTDQLIGFSPSTFIRYNELDGDGAITVNDMDTTTPIKLLGSTAASNSCHLLDWVPRFAFEAGRHGTNSSDDIMVGPWRSEVIYDFEDCPDDTPPPDTSRLACDPASGPPSVAFYASWNAHASDFITATCGQVIRYCQRGRSFGNPPPANWPCPCDPTKYTCGYSMLDI
ncbi:MAG TPA: hypothetical protein VK607_15770 [Kofleriaceae bacterium]|nr:hypothetical protein [Kofleriaceae bacterium]